MPAHNAHFERLESRQHLSATPTPFPTDGGGVYASATSPSAVSPKVTALIVSQGANADGLTDVDRDSGLTAEVSLPNGAVNESTLVYSLSADKTTFNSTSTVRLYRVRDGLPVDCAKPQTSGGGDTITIQPRSPLAPNETYRLEILVGVKDVSGVSFEPKAFVFTTGTGISVGDPDINFSQTTTRAAAKPYSAVAIGPDGKLYAATLEGYIYRFDIRTNPLLDSTEKTIKLVRDNNGGNRFITGITFDPRSTAENPILWVSHGQAKYGDVANTSPTNPNGYADNFTGKISVIAGNDLDTYFDMVVNLPRSVKDHLNNQITFLADGKNFVWSQPSMNAMGAPDKVWGKKEETILSAAILRADVAKLEAYVNANGPLNAQDYNPYKGGNPVRIYATGVRNAYELIQHSNGHLYAPANGSSSGGKTPAEPAKHVQVPQSKRIDYSATAPYRVSGVPALTDVPVAEDDLLYDIVEAGYYGHPNKLRGEYVLNGGNPTSGRDPYETGAYPVGTQPDRNYRGAAYSFGTHVSPNGVIEYQSDAFGGKLKGQLLVAQFAEGDSIIALDPEDDGTINSKRGVSKGITGLTRGLLENPLDLVEDPVTGNLYVVQLTNNRRSGTITLLKPQNADPQIVIAKARVSVYTTPGSTGDTSPLTVTNNGTTNLVIDPAFTKLTGGDRKNFLIVNLPKEPVTLLPGDSFTFTIKFKLLAGDTASKKANIVIRSNVEATPDAVVQLRGFASTAGVTASSHSGGVFASAVGAKLNTGGARQFFNAVKGGAVQSREFTIRNTGDANLILPAEAFKLIGADRKRFALLDYPKAGATIKPGKSLTMTLLYQAAADDTTIKTATLQITSNAVGKPLTRINLRGLPTAGEGGNLEPSLAKLMELYQYDIRVGDSNPNNTVLDVPPVGATDEVKVQRLVKAGKGSVSVVPLASFGVATDPVVRLGWYRPGDLQDENYVWKIAAGDAQSVAAKAVGVEQFDPGTTPFGLVGEFPGFNDADGTMRQVYSEDDLNFWESKSDARRKMRFYDLGNDSFLVAVEEFTSAYDQQDLLFVVKNVKIAPTQPVLSIENTTAGLSYQDRLIFSNIKNLDTDVPNYSRNQQRIRIRNTGNASLALSNIAVTGEFNIISGSAGSIAAGSYKDITIGFTADVENLYTGTLTLTSNDPANPTRTIQLAGYFQEDSEQGSDRIQDEPTSQEILQLFGITTTLTRGTERLNRGGLVQAVGDEVLSPYWRSADASGIVSVHEIATYHTQGTVTYFNWFKKGNTGSVTRVFGHAREDGQTLLPRKIGTSTVVASGSFKTTDQFGLKIDTSWSDPKLNAQDRSGGNYGHRVRWFPYRDRDGKLIDNTYVVLVDYFNNNYSNYDYNDDVFIVSNVVPAGEPETPDLLQGYESAGGAQLFWTNPGDRDIVGYNVYRSETAGGRVTKLNASILAGLSYTDTTVSVADSKWYHVTSVWADGSESPASMIQI